MNKFLAACAAALCLLLAGEGGARAQFVDSTTGLMQAPSADMEPDATFMITNGWWSKEMLDSRGWGYDTFGYGFSVSFFGRLEVAYVLTIFDGKRKPNPSERDKIMFNQDRHFAARLLLLKEGEFGLDWMPAVLAGVSDPTTGSGGDYLDHNVSGAGNGYFNREYIVLTKHFATGLGEFGAHLGYIYNNRINYRLDGPCAGIDWKPVWLQDKGFLTGVRLIAEYDARTFNYGFVTSVWDDRFEALVECLGSRAFNFGLRYKLRLTKH